MDHVLEEKDAADWVYIGEGAANIVVAYNGSSPALVGKVLRIQKIPEKGSNGITGSSVFSTHELLLWKDHKDIILSPNRGTAAQLYVERVMSQLLGSKHVDAGVCLVISRSWPPSYYCNRCWYELLLWKDHKEILLSSNREIAAQLYVEHVMSQLLGSKHVDAEIQVLVSKAFLGAVEKNINCKRPDWRISTARVDRHCKYVLLISDHSRFPHGVLKDDPCISVEIKPKCGFLPTSKYIAQKNAIKKTITRFKMHQTLKFHDKEISKISEYNPLDLFSGSKDRMHRALEALYDTPQNNFRVFFDGSLILGCLGGASDCTTKLIGEKLEDALKPIIQSDDGLRTRSFLELIVETIHKSGVLDRLLNVQKLDNYDVEGAIHAYYNIVSQPCIACKELREDGLLHEWNTLHSLSLDESLKIVKDFLISATVKDCSLMMCFKPRGVVSNSSYNSVQLESTGQVFEYKAFFIDLDLKPLNKMEHYYKLDQKIVKCYKEIAGEECLAESHRSMEAYKRTN